MEFMSYDIVVQLYTVRLGLFGSHEIRIPDAYRASLWPWWRRGFVVQVVQSTTGTIAERVSLFL
jgi:hypothetical protein